MNKKRNLKLIVIVPLIIIMAVYFSVPMISKPIIESKLPDNMQLLKWDMKFLSFNKLCVNQLTVRIDLEAIKNEISIQNACINYFSRNIDIEKIITKSHEQLINLTLLKQRELNPISIAPIFLPKINLSSIEQLSKIGDLKIALLQSYYSTLDNITYNLLAANIELNRDSDATAKFSIKQIDINRRQGSKTKQKVLTGRLGINADSETIEVLFVDSNHNELVNLEFNQTLSQRSLDLTLASNLLLNQLKHFISKTAFDYLPSDSIKLEIIRDLISDKQHINLSTQFNPSKPHAEPVIFKLELLLTNFPKTNQVWLQIESELNGKPSLFEHLDLNELIQVDFNKISSVTNIKLSTSANKLKSINELSSVINIDQPNYQKNSDEASQIVANFDKFKISINSDKILPFNSFKSLIQAFSIQGKVAGEKFSSKFMSDGLELEIGKADFDEEPTLSIDFKLAKRDDYYHSSGSVKLSDFLSDMVTNNKSDSLNNKSENIKAALKGVLRWDDLSATFNTVDDKTQPKIHSSKFILNIEGSDLVTSKLDLTDFTFNSKASITDNKLIASGDFDISKSRLASIQLSSDDIFSVDRPISLVIKNPKIGNELISQLASSLISKIDSKNEISLAISKGTIEHSNRIKMGDKLNLESDLALHQFDLDINSVFLIGLNYQQSIKSLEPLNLSAELDIREVTFASGLLLSNISTTLAVKEKNSSAKLDKSKLGKINIEKNKSINISISNLKANIWNGQIQSQSIIIEKGNLKPSIINLKNIDLTELIFFLDMKGLYADGNIDIHIPIEQQNGKYIVKNGHFASNQPGIIKYDSGQEQADVEANIALHALQDFHYQKLDGTINYDKDGAYEIKLHLLGSNPSLYDGYPIDFSLNLSGELSDVFQSVFLTGDFEKSILERAKMNQLVP
ncbi:MAG: hypothetical protein COA86_00115 [Kangiella sp.]|nr:MAG: hypothetical protein COA86_00115 [Kangiella sp.]